MLFEAIERGDAGSVWQQVQRGIRFDQLDESTELTPLALAAEAGHAEIVRTLLSAGANPDLGGATTPLEAAVVGGHHEVVKVLLRHNADVNKAVEEGFTPLMTAATTGDLVLVQILLEAGARPLAKNDDGDTAITLAEDTGHLGVAAFLRARRAKRAQPTNNGSRATPPQRPKKESPETTNSELAAIVRETKLKATRKPAQEDAASSDTTPPLAATETAAAETADHQEEVPHESAPAERAPAVEDVHEPASAEGSPPVEGTVESDAGRENSASVESMSAEAASLPPTAIPIDAEEDFDAATIGATELQTALDHLGKLCVQGTGRAAKALRDGNPAPHLTDDQGFTLLMVAAQAGESEIVRLLLAAGADTARCDATDDGFCALVWAIRSPSERRIEVIKALVEAGADPDQRCGLNERTPLMFAAQADVYLDRPEGPSFGNTTRTLIELGAEIEAQDRRGLTVWRLIKRDALGAPTFGSSRRRLHQMVRLLEYCGAQPIESHAV